MDQTRGELEHCGICNRFHGENEPAPCREPRETIGQECDRLILEWEQDRLTPIPAFA